MGVDTKLEVVVIPVSDVERAKQFYEGRLGWRLDADIAPTDAFRIVTDIDAARADLAARGVEVAGVREQAGDELPT
jgi:catechol 2,3-dioxygenase-like lactoylglutathione lyase family enzyme